MPVTPPLNFQKWIDEHRHLLKPPVMNQVVYHDNQDFIVMVVGGPNSRKDYHYNETEEFFYQLEGEIVVKIIDDGQPRDIRIGPGDIFLLPARTPHSPRRPAGSIGLVMEVKRPKDVNDGFLWFCESCGHKLYEVKLPVQDIVRDLPVVMKSFYDDEKLRTCTQCGEVFEKL
jgi:3-hydroxyanthranilate 3,4-dioxygenase